MRHRLERGSRTTNNQLRSVSTLTVRSSGNRECGRMNAKVIEKCFQPIYGQPCWGLSYDRQLNLSMSFGQPLLKVREPYKSRSKSDFVQRIAARRRVTIKGRWWLWLVCCNWSITSDGLPLATSSSSRRKIQFAIGQLSGQELVSVDVEPRAVVTRFAFDLGCILQCRPFKGDAGQLWMLRKPSGYYLSVYGNGTFSHQRGTDGVNRFQPIEAKGRLEDG